LGSLGLARKPRHRYSDSKSNRNSRSGGRSSSRSRSRSRRKSPNTRRKTKGHSRLTTFRDPRKEKKERPDIFLAFHQHQKRNTYFQSQKSGWEQLRGRGGRRKQRRKGGSSVFSLLPFIWTQPRQLLIHGSLAQRICKGDRTSARLEAVVCIQGPQTSSISPLFPLFSSSVSGQVDRKSLLLYLDSFPLQYKGLWRTSLCGRDMAEKGKRNEY